MSSLNQTFVMGNLTREVEIRYTPKGTAVAELGLAINRVYSTDSGERREEVTFLDITVWGRDAEIAGEYLTKGSPVLIHGRLQTEQWEDKQTGQKRSKLKVVCERLHLIGRKRESDQSEPAERQSARSAGARATHERNAGYGPSARTPAPRPPADPDLDAQEEDIPF
jgi:single-strand DNA-binding protein